MVKSLTNILTSVSSAPRFIRLRDAAAYLGMDKNRFNRDVRPHLCTIPIGTQGIASIALTSTPGRMNIRTATGVPRLH